MKKAAFSVTSTYTPKEKSCANARPSSVSKKRIISATSKSRSASRSASGDEPTVGDEEEATGAGGKEGITTGLELEEEEAAKDEEDAFEVEALLLLGQPMGLGRRVIV